MISRWRSGDVEMLIRQMAPADLPRLQELSPASVKDVIDFAVYPTLVCEVDGVIAGYTQFVLTPDGILHSRALRVGKEFKGRGIGAALMQHKETLAKSAGASLHIYPVDPHGEDALKKILVKQGMHLCQKREHLWLYVKLLEGAE